MPNQDLGSLTMLGSASVAATFNAAHTLGTSMTGAASMPAPTLGLFEHLASGMTADSSVGAGLTALYSVSGIPQGDSTLASNAALLMAAEAGLTGDSSGTIAAGVNYAEAASLTADSTMAAAAFEFESEFASISADSSLTAGLFVLRGCVTQLAGDSLFAIDPSGVVVTRITQAPAVPPNAKPPVVPQLRISPPSPPVPSFSVSTSPPRRTPR